jgi:hypothetical protein
MRTRGIYCIAGLVLAAIAIVYWPVTHFDFVWDDWRSFHDTPWLTEGDNWKHYIFRDFNNWTVYFRPLVLAFLTLQVRLFDSNPGPMHAVSLGLHMVDTLLVGLLAWRCSRNVTSKTAQQAGAVAISMLLYGFHPVLTEPVAWIGCQFDLIATLFMLLGLLTNAQIQRRGVRAVVVGTIFFLAINSKESSISFPLLVVIFDLALLSKEASDGVLSSIRKLIRENGKTYVAIVVAFLLYLLFRRWGLGDWSFNPSKDDSYVSPLLRFQEVCAVYVHYWRTLFWPMPGIGPIHPVDLGRFAFLSGLSILTDVIAIGVFAGGLYLAIRRASPVGYIVLAVTASLAPVLHITFSQLDLSLYHERYAMTALSVMCAMLPLLLVHAPVATRARKLGNSVLSIALFFWLAFAVIDIRFVLPTWTNDMTLWKWAYVMYPHVSQSKENLLNAYIRYKDYSDARILGDEEIADAAPCTTCMLDIADLAQKQGDPSRALLALDTAARSKLLATNKDLLQRYYLIAGRALILQGRLHDAEHVLDLSAALNPNDPQPRLSLATTLALQGKSDEAKQLGVSAIGMLPANERAPALQSLNAEIDAGRENAQRLQNNN